MGPLRIAFLLALGLAAASPGGADGPHGLRGRVVATDGSPLKSFRVRAIGDVPSAETGRRRVELERAFTSADGGFALAGLQGGTWRLEVGAEGHAVMVAARLKLGEGAPPVDPLTFPLFREARLSGRVIDARTGTPIEGARVGARLHLDHRKASPLETLPAVLTAKDGTFTLGGFAPAGWELRVEKEGYLVHDGQRFDPAEGQSVGSFLARLGVGGTVEGRAVRADGSALAGAEVLVMDVRGVAGRAVTDAEGRFEIPLVKPGRYRVEVRELQADGGVGPVELEAQVAVFEGERTPAPLRAPAR